MTSYLSKSLSLRLALSLGVILVAVSIGVTASQPSLFSALPALALGGLIAIAYPFRVLLFLFLLLLQLPQHVLPSLSLGQIDIRLSDIVFAALLLRGMGDRRPLPGGRVVGLVVVLFAGSVLSLINGVSVLGSDSLILVKTYVKLLEGMLLGVIGFWHVRERGFEGTWHTVMFLTAVHALVVIGTQIVYGISNTIAPTTGLLLIPGLAYATHKLGAEGFTLRRALFASVVSVAILLSGSRTMWVGSLPVVIGALWQYGKAHRKTIVAASGATVGAAVWLFHEALSSKIVDVLSSLDALRAGTWIQSSTSLRLLLWVNGFRVFMDHPLLGTGIDSFGHLNGRYLGEFLSTNQVAIQPYVWMKMLDTYQLAHNQYLQWLVDTGLVGFGLFVLLLYTVWGILGRLPSAPRAYLRSAWVGIILMFGTHTFLIYNGEGTSLYFWWFLGLIVGIPLQGVNKCLASE